MSRHLTRCAPAALIAAFLLSTNLPLLAQEPDWPQWRGPRRDGICDEKGLLRSWPEGGPELLWKASGLGRGYSSPIVAGDTIFITGDKDDDLVVSAFKLDGSARWQTHNGQSWQKSFPGARSSCAYDNGKLYHMNAHGRLACLEAATGAESWAVNVLDRFEGKNVVWGLAESVLVDGHRVIATPAAGKALMVALDKLTGETVWACPPLPEERSSYSSTILVASGGRRMLINGGAEYAFAVDADSGKLCWKTPQIDPDNAVGVTPVLSGDRLFFTNGSRTFGAMFCVKLGDMPGEKAWTQELKIGHGGLVCVDGRLYGVSSRGLQGWLAIDAATGAPAAMAEMQPGSLIYADERFYCLTQRGTMTLQALTAHGFKTVGSFELADKKDVWAHPVICRGRLYLRCDDTLFCFDIRS